MSLFNECLSKSSYVNQLLDGFFKMLMDIDVNGVDCDGLTEEELHALWDNYYNQEPRDNMIGHIINCLINKFIYVYVEFFESNNESVSYELFNQLWMYSLCN